MKALQGMCSATNCTHPVNPTEVVARASARLYHHDAVLNSPGYVVPLTYQLNDAKERLEMFLSFQWIDGRPLGLWLSRLYGCRKYVALANEVYFPPLSEMEVMWSGPASGISRCRVGR